MRDKGFKKHLPDSSVTRRRLYNMIGGNNDDGNAIQRWVKDTIAQPMVWHLNRRSVAGGVAVGLFISWLPIPMQMLIAAVLAAVLRVHVPVSVVMVWFTNPLTLAPLLYAAWQSGSMILGKPVLSGPMQMSTHSFLAGIGDAWPTLLVGMLFCASVSAVIGFALTLVAWRYNAIRRWRQRRSR